MGCRVQTENRLEHRHLFPSREIIFQAQGPLFKLLWHPQREYFRAASRSMDGGLAWLCVSSGGVDAGRTESPVYDSFSSRLAIMQFVTHLQHLKGEICISSHFAQREAFFTFWCHIFPRSSSFPGGTALLWVPKGCGFCGALFGSHTSLMALQVTKSFCSCSRVSPTPSQRSLRGTREQGCVPGPRSLGPSN